MVDKKVIEDFTEPLKALIKEFGTELDYNYVIKDMTPLMVASMLGDVESVKLLIKAGADVNYQYQCGKTSLMYAAEEGHGDVVGILIEAGADLNLKSSTCSPEENQMLSGELEEDYSNIVIGYNDSNYIDQLQ